ncbi:hypothetical protein EDC55_12416 [Allofrancisella inopinata]|uniref:Uncharacterized protein n=1 Tax=Allofrancisella inopinata TaxID=1085647 RepID=A0AAE7CR55_9GAMM|nr:hypothetical protein [Allofrancisella inopinata]QIV96645.1 hypothetical protein E4K63_07305 [Allofrancisella inopinata]TDT67395.1 hypothetical protein EDC55_12416 [Allofrancisella inopinata]
MDIIEFGPYGKTLEMVNPVILEQINSRYEEVSKKDFGYHHAKSLLKLNQSCIGMINQLEIGFNQALTIRNNGPKSNKQSSCIALENAIKKLRHLKYDFEYSSRQLKSATEMSDLSPFHPSSIAISKDAINTPRMRNSLLDPIFAAFAFIYTIHDITSGLSNDLIKVNFNQVSPVPNILLAINNISTYLNLDKINENNNKEYYPFFSQIVIKWLQCVYAKHVFNIEEYRSRDVQHYKDTFKRIEDIRTSYTDRNKIQFIQDIIPIWKNFLAINGKYLQYSRNEALSLIANKQHRIHSAVFKKNVMGIKDAAIEYHFRKLDSIIFSLENLVSGQLTIMREKQDNELSLKNVESRISDNRLEFDKNYGIYSKKMGTIQNLEKSFNDIKNKLDSLDKELDAYIKKNSGISIYEQDYLDYKEKYSGFEKAKCAIQDEIKKQTVESRKCQDTYVKNNIKYNDYNNDLNTLKNKIIEAQEALYLNKDSYNELMQKWNSISKQIEKLIKLQNCEDKYRVLQQYNHQFSDLCQKYSSH